MAHRGGEDDLYPYIFLGHLQTLTAALEMNTSHLSHWLDWTLKSSSAPEAQSQVLPVVDYLTGTSGDHLGSQCFPSQISQLIVSVESFPSTARAN
jgi:hypothetical protein